MINRPPPPPSSTSITRRLKPQRRRKKKCLLSNSPSLGSEMRRAQFLRRWGVMRQAGGWEDDLDKFPLKEGGGNGLWDRLILIPPYKVALARPTPPIPTLTVEKQVPCRIRCPAMREQSHTFRTLSFPRKKTVLILPWFPTFTDGNIKFFSCMNITRCSPLNFIILILMRGISGTSYYIMQSHMHFLSGYSSKFVHRIWFQAKGRNIY